MAATLNAASGYSWPAWRRETPHRPIQLRRNTAELHQGGADLDRISKSVERVSRVAASLPETIEASLQLGEMVLMGIGVPDEAARRVIESRRQAEQASIDESLAKATSEPLSKPLVKLP